MERHMAIYRILERIKDFHYEHLNDYGVDCEIKEIGKMIDAISSKNEWISVEDRLPEIGKSVLIYIDNELFFDMITLGFYGNGGWSQPDVTHWMLLPESPESEE